MSSLKIKYFQIIAPKLAKEFGQKNVMAAPKVEKIVVNIGLGAATEDKTLIESASQDLAVITGQRPKVCKARKAISGFKLQKGDSIGLTVTLRGKRMYVFLEKLVKIVMPRLRDFQGVSLKSFDGRGNYSLGISEQAVFPEVQYEKIKRALGLEITIVTNAGHDQKGKRLLEELGMPFEKREPESKRVKE